jgi:hypothetical protein
MLAGGAVASAALCALAGCSLLGGSTKTAATVTAPPPTPSSAPSSYSPLSGPVEAAAALPKECSQLLSTAQLQAVFGSDLPIGDEYGSYAGLPSIGRTGRVSCVFGVGLDSFGQQSTGSVEVSLATYTSASDAVGRAADTVQTDSQAGATTATVSVGGHPATIVVEQTQVGASSSAPTTPGTPATPGTPTTAPATVPGAPASSAAATSSPSTTNGETELVMADGNRTFVLQIPFTKLSAQQAVTALTKLALDAYQDTLPAPAASGTPGSSTR